MKWSDLDEVQIMFMSTLGVLIVGLALTGRAHAQDEEIDRVTPFSGDLALTLGRNFEQGLTVGGLVGELKVNVDPQIAVGARFGGTLGTALGLGATQAYVGAPILLKGEGFLNTERNRPFVGLGAGLTFVTGGGAYVSWWDASVVGYGLVGVMPTIMPEVGVDIGALRLSVSHSVLLGSPRGIAAELDFSGVDVGREHLPGLSGTMLQIGGHLGGVRKSGSNRLATW